MTIRYIFCLTIFLIASSPSFSQSNPGKLNPEIAKMIKEVSAKNIEATIRKLVSFGTRNTLSDQNDDRCRMD